MGKLKNKAIFGSQGKIYERNVADYVIPRKKLTSGWRASLKNVAKIPW